MPLFRVLHLSDIHIGNTYKPSEEIGYRVISNIEQNGLYPIQVVAITGDIFDGPAGIAEDLVDEAVAFFYTLLKEINNSQPNHPIEKTDFIFIPGNHDIVRTDNIVEQWNKYRSFLTKFYGSLPNWYNTENFSICKVYQNEKVVFIGFNSCHLEKKKIFDKNYINTFRQSIDANTLANQGIDKEKLIDILESQTGDEYQDYGYIHPAQLTEVRRKLKNYDDYIIIALFHHHFYLFPEISKRFGDSSLIRNYTEVLHQLKYMNVKTVLHGHKHYDLESPFITEDYYDSTESIIDVFAGGSLGTARKDRHTFNVLDFYDKNEGIKLIQKKFIYNDERLEDIKLKQIPPKNIANKIVKLCEIVESSNPSVYKSYVECSEKLFKIHSDCKQITSWVSEVLTGFNETYKYLTADFRNVLFILYAINYRTLSYMDMIENDKTYFENSSSILTDFYMLHMQSDNFSVSSDEYHKLFLIKDLKRLSNACDNLLNMSSNRLTNEYLAFTMMGIFFADLYLILTKYADDFKESIEHKVNIKIEENKFHENVPAPRIILKSDADRRSVSIQLRCNEATAHKMAVLFIKEFDLLINKFEDYFKTIGLKLYYIFPSIDKDNLKDSLDNYNFEAYIPTLLPLLTGDNIYHSKVVFARELIQNSIDAIAVREAKNKNEFSKTITIEIGIDEKSRRYFKISDCGTGMDRYKIERYFTSIGRSFYSGDEFEDLQISYKPISNFGIGFLSSFMVCKEIDVKTKYYEANSEGLKLHIPNYDGCFFIDKEDLTEIGTDLKLYLKCRLKDKDIIDYIKKIMIDIKYDIIIKSRGKNVSEIFIPAHQIRKEHSNSKLVFFIPLTENNEVLSINYNKEVLTGIFKDKYEYGILICGKLVPDSTYGCILNAGILVEQALISTLFNFDKDYDYRYSYTRSRELLYNSIYMNFPANWIQLDVSREKLTGFSEQIINLEKNKQLDAVGIRIASALCKQIIDFIEYSKKGITDIPVVCLQEVINDGLDFCKMYPDSDAHKQLNSLRYSLQITFSKSEVIFEICHRGESKKSAINYTEGVSSKNKRDLIKRWERLGSKNHIVTNLLDERSGFSREVYRYLEEFTYIISKGRHVNKDISSRFKEFFYDLQLDFNSGNDDVFCFLAMLLMNIPDEDITGDSKRMSPLLFFIESIVMQILTVRDIENGSNKIKVSYDMISKYLENLRIKTS